MSLSASSTMSRAEAHNIPGCSVRSIASRCEGQLRRSEHNLSSFSQLDLTCKGSQESCSGRMDHTVMPKVNRKYKCDGYYPQRWRNDEGQPLVGAIPASAILPYSSLAVDAAPAWMSSANPYALPDTLNVLEWQSWHQGILAGCLVFFSTVCVVIYLLVAGGSFQRMKEQAEAYKTMGSRAFQAPLTSKPRLYDTLLEAAKTLPLRPSLGDQDALVGVCVELQVLPTLRAGAEVNPSMQTLFDISDGSARYGHGSYDSIERVWRWLPGGPYENSAAMQDALRGRQEQCQDRLDLIIKDKRSGYIVGMASIVNNRPRHLAAGIGEVFITPAFRGTYVLPETILLLLSHLFKQGYRRIEWQCDTDNTVAKKAAEKLAFFEEGVLRKHMICRDVNRDTVVMSLTNSDWRDGAERVVRERVRAKIKKATTAEAITRRLLEELDQEAERGECANKKDK